MSIELTKIIEELDLDVQAGAEALHHEVTGVYVSDMLSDVIAHSGAGHIWITLQIHMNIIAVARLKEITGIIIVNGREIGDDVREKADEEKIPVMGTDMNTYQLAGKLYAMGVGSADEDV